MRNVVIASAVRTAGGSFGGSLKSLSAANLGAAVIREAVIRAGIDGSEVNQVIFGNGWQAGGGPNPARLSTVWGGLPNSCPAFTVNIRCGSGLRALQLGTVSIMAGETDVVLAGGMESATNVPYLAEGERWGARMGDAKLVDLLHRDGFQCPLAGMMMGSTGELLAERYKISREAQDEFALESHRRAVKAIEEGAFMDEIVPVEIVEKKNNIIFRIDEIPRQDTSMEKLAKLPAIFKKDGGVTAGNSSALCDGASAIVLMEEKKASAINVRPLARILSYSFIALDPHYMGLGPVEAIPDALQKARLDMADIDLFEINEAFAVQVLACNRKLHIDPAKLNIHGGAIALGHPVGATGAKILTTLLYALRRYNKRYGIVSLCIGGGQGVAMVIENLG